MTSTAAFSPRACSGRWSCPATPSRSATTGGGRPWKPRMSACWTASSSAGRPPSRPRSASRSVGGHRPTGASRQRLDGPTHRPGGVPGPFRHRPVHRVVLRIRGRLQLHGQGRHRPRLCPVRPRAQRRLPLIGMPLGAPACPDRPSRASGPAPGTPSTSGASTSPGCLSHAPTCSVIRGSHSSTRCSAQWKQPVCWRKAPMGLAGALVGDRGAVASPETSSPPTA